MEYQPLPSLGERANSNYYRRDRGICPAPKEEKGYRFCPHIPEDLGEFWMQVPFRGKVLTVEKRGGTVSLEEADIQSFVGEEKIKCVFNKVELGE